MGKIKYPKHFLVIKDKVYDIGNNITIEYDLDQVLYTATLSIPFYTTEQWSTSNLQKYDAIKIYFGWFDSAAERNAASYSDCTQVMNGYIDTLPLNESKAEGTNYNSITIKSIMGLSYERTTTTPFYNAVIREIIEKGLTETDLIGLITAVNLNGITENFVAFINSELFFGKVLDEIKEKYAIQIYETPDGFLNINTPVYMNNQNLTAHVFDLKQNVFNIDYGELSNAYDSVIVYGLNCVGIAFDPIAYQLKLGVSPDDLESDVVPTRENLNPLKIYRRDVQSAETCQEIAKNKLVELARNYSISFSAEYEPTYKVGDLFIVNNSKVIPNTQKWIIKKINVNISKENISCDIVGYSNSITDFPDNLLLPSSGLLDTDVLEITEQIESEISLR